MSPAWIALALAAGGATAFFVMAPLAKAAEPERQPPRVWRVQVCDAADRCEFRGAALSGPTACNLDLASLANTLPAGTRLSCVKEQKR